MPRYPLAACLLLIPLPFNAIAAPIDSLAPVLITATRTSQTADNSLAAVTIITREDIQRSQAQTVLEVLQHTPGVNFSNNGGLGKVSGIFLRGAESDQVLVLIDGVKVGSPTAGVFSFQSFPLSQIEKIEIVRGPRSSLYGSEAIGGVIQIFTHRGKPGEKTTSLTLGASQHNTYELSAGLSGGGENSWYSINGNTLESDGYNACYGKPFPDGAGCFTLEPDDDGHQNQSLQTNLGFQLTDKITVDFHAIHNGAETEFDGAFQNETKTLQLVFGTELQMNFTDNYVLKLNAGHSRDDSENFKDGVFSSRFDTLRNSFSLQNDFAIDDQHLFTLGFDYQRDEVDSTTQYLETQRDNQAVFAQYQSHFKQYDFQLALRQDDNEQFGSHNTGNFSLGMEASNRLRYTLSYGTAFKAPNFNELYFPDFGNPNLTPEESSSVELGLARNNGHAQWHINFFQTKIDKMIAIDPDIFKPKNISKAEIQGVEIGINGKMNNWIMNSHYHYLDHENLDAGTNRGKALPRRANHTLSLGIDREFAAFSLGGTLHTQGKSYDNLDNSRGLDGFSTVDLRGSYAMHPNWQLGLRMTNLFDETYETASFYNQDGANFWLNLRYAPSGK